MTGLAITGDSAVVKDNGLKILNDMTPIAFTVSRYMSLMFTGSNNSVMAYAAATGNASMIVTAVCVKFEKTGGIVTVVTFRTGFRVLVRFANGAYTVMTLTARAKNFQVIHKRDDIKAECGMAGRA